MSDVRTTLVWLLRDEVSGTARKISGSLDGLGLKAKGSGTNMALLAGGAIALGAALFGVAKKAAEEEVNVAKLGASLRANVKDWDGNTAAIEKTISAREQLAFSDDELRSSMSLLLAATHDVGKAFDVQSVAMDLARFKNISLDEAATALTRVEGGQFRALKALGIVLKDGATATEALAAVEKVAAGQAAAYADTHIGKLKRLEIAWNDALESAGGAVLEFGDTLDKGIGVANDQLALLQDALTGTGVTAKGVSMRPMVKQLNNVSLEARDARNALADILDAAKLAADITGTLPFLSATGEAVTTGVQTAAELARARRHAGKVAAGAGQPHATLPGHAAGGWVGMSGPETVRVGERGPEYITPTTPNGQGGGGGFTIQGVSEAQIVAMVDRGLYFKLNRASPSAVRK